MRLLAQVRRAGRGRRERTDWYTLGLGLLIIAGLPVQALIGLTVKPAPSTSHAATSPVALFLGAAVLLAALVLSLALAMGPVRASADEYSWVLGGPVDRRAELAPRWIGMVGLNAALGGTLAVVGAVLGRAAPGNIGPIAACGIGLGIAVAGLATGLQGCADHVRQRVQLIATAVGVFALGLAAYLTRTDAALNLPAATGVVGALVAVVAAVVSTWWGWRAIPGLDRIALMSGNMLATASGAAFLFMDPSLLGDVLAERQLSRLNIRRSRVFPAGRRRGLLAADLARTVRNGRKFGVFVAALFVAYAIASAVDPRWVPTVVLLCAVPAVSPFGAGLRQICRSPALRRMLGGTNLTLRTIHLVVPTVAALLFTVAAASAGRPIHWAALAVVPVAVLANLWLRATAKPFEISTKVADLGLGPMPVDLLPFLIRGIAPLAIAVALQLQI